MVKLRLQRIGKKNSPAFRIVAITSSNKAKGEVLEFLGNYNPFTKKVNITKDRVEYWLSQGAQPSETMKNLLVKQDMLKADKEKHVYHKQPGRKKTAQKGKETEKKPAEKTEKTADKAPEAPAKAETKEEKA